eukprot:NODE_22_length_38364_cov_0.248661.p27 type:complete len:108 gc:universal NODE_22_length_38364_cov_0.248661:23920-24243(+)
MEVFHWKSSTNFVASNFYGYSRTAILERISLTRILASIFTPTFLKRTFPARTTYGPILITVILQISLRAQWTTTYLIKLRNWKPLWALLLALFGKIASDNLLRCIMN